MIKYFYNDLAKAFKSAGFAVSTDYGATVDKPTACFMFIADEENSAYENGKSSEREATFQVFLKAPVKKESEILTAQTDLYEALQTALDSFELVERKKYITNGINLYGLYPGSDKEKSNICFILNCGIIYSFGE